MPENEPAITVPPYVQARAEGIVNSAIKNRGDVRSVRTIYGYIKSPDDEHCEIVWSQYLEDAMKEVNDGNWQEAEAIARDKALRRTIQTLMNQG